jgi:hypothetical protein
MELNSDYAGRTGKRRLGLESLFDKNMKHGSKYASHRALYGMIGPKSGAFRVGRQELSSNYFVF